MQSAYSLSPHYLWWQSPLQQPQRFHQWLQQPRQVPGCRYHVWHSQTCMMVTTPPGSGSFSSVCLTYIHLSGDSFNSDTLKIAWVLSYMKARQTSTYMLHVLRCLRGVGSFINWAAFEKDFRAEFLPFDPAKSAALVLRNREQYEQGKWILDKYIDSFKVLVEQAAYSDGL
ncbi:hypothetical protein C0993_004462 [Termitomyces sp. T159_Od127]|nr:hypothetical protein C0993_004462 [Termitomyces sp. T159_Od127]